MTTASTTVGSRQARAQEIMGSLAWAVLATHSSGDAVRANQLLVAFQRLWAVYGSAVLAGQSATVTQRYGSVAVTGRWDLQTSGAMAVTFLVILPSAFSYGQADADALLHTADRGGGVAGAATLWRERIMDYAPLGHEPIWRVFDWARQVAPMDVGTHLEQRVEDFVDGLSAQPVPATAQSAGVPVGTEQVFGGEEIAVTAIVQRGGTRTYWPWAVAGIGVAVFGGVVAWKIWGKKGRRR